MKPADLETCREAFARWAADLSPESILLMSPDPPQTDLFRELFPKAEIVEWHIQHYNIDQGPPSREFDIAFAANTFLCSQDPERWLNNVLSRCGELWLQEPVRAWREAQSECSPTTGDHTRFTFPSRGELSRVPGFDLEASTVAEIIDVVFYSDDGAGRPGAEDYKDCRKFVARLVWKGDDIRLPSCIILDEEGTKAFTEALENPPEPTPALVELFKKHGPP